MVARCPNCFSRIVDIRHILRSKRRSYKPLADLSQLINHLYDSNAYQRDVIGSFREIKEPAR